jgi:hydroxyacyl-ACP dehydratase HTD2-like protein with hotdog domain
MINSNKKPKEFKFSKTEIKNFCKLTKDNNPIHLDKKYLRNTNYSNLIVPGILIISKINQIISINYKGAIIIEIISTFREPIFINKKYKINFKIIRINKKSNLFKLQSVIKDKTKKVLVDINFILPK